MRDSTSPVLLPFPAPPQRGHIAALDGVRGLAILCVLITHGIGLALVPATGLERAVYNVARWGWIGVDLFFVLSGFLITGILLHSRDRPGYLRNFLARRALRIFPLYYATVLVCLVVLPLLPLASLDWLRDLSRQQAWFWLHLSNYYTICINDPPVYWMSTLWSLAVEEHFYLVWPFVVLCLSERSLIRVCLTGALFALALRMVLVQTGFSWEYIYRSTLTRIDPLLLGACLAVLARRPQGLARLLPLARFALVMGLGMLGMHLMARGGASGRDDSWYGCTGQYSVVGLMFGGLLVVVLQAKPASRITHVFTARPLLVLGKYSYAMYILNKPMFKLASWCLSPGEWMLFGSQLPALVCCVALGVGLTLLGALASWHLLEKHFLGLKRFFEAVPSTPPARRTAPLGVAARTAALVIVLALPGRMLHASTGLDFFETKVRPMLAEHCTSCHSANKKRGGLALDTPAGILRGGDSGPAVVPGKPERSLLLEVVRYARPDLRMPPRGKLPAPLVADLEQWVRTGAPLPSAHSGSAKSNETVSRDLWSLRPPQPPPVPEVRDDRWSACDIDCFIQARLEDRGLSPAADASRQAYIRRVSFDLLGLPPTPEEIEAFVHDRTANAREKLVDRLLASPAFGEKWGRHWLDLARFAESAGAGRTILFREAWRYRDHVIATFNRDRPFADFVREQIAGDLLPSSSAEQRREQLIATGFLALGPTIYEQRDKKALGMDVVAEQLDTLGRTFLGLTLGCARCHDHKFDPISQKDFYALAGILASTRTLVHEVEDGASRWVEQPLPGTADEEARWRQHEPVVAALYASLREARVAREKETALAARAAAAAEIERLEVELQRLTRAGLARPLAMAVREADEVGDCRLRIRGNSAALGDPVPRALLPAATIGPAQAIPASESGRRLLADWLAGRGNPLTARVLVNRVWHHLFGAGLVRTVDNFGLSGEPPSHPQLLDHLAIRFLREGESLKRLVRTLVLSRTYGQSSEDRPETHDIDPDNRLLGRMNRRRLSAEAIRDAILVAGDSLDRRMGGSTIRPGTTVLYTYAFDDQRRSIYTPIFRAALPEMFEVFDFADPNASTGQRPTSTTSPQALYLMNSPFVMDAAESAANHLASFEGDRLSQAFALTLGRPPTVSERAALRKYQEAQSWGRIYHVLFSCVDFRYLP